MKIQYPVVAMLLVAMISGLSVAQTNHDLQLKLKVSPPSLGSSNIPIVGPDSLPLEPIEKAGPVVARQSRSTTTPKTAKPPANNLVQKENLKTVKSRTRSPTSTSSPPITLSFETTHSPVTINRQADNEIPKEEEANKISIWGWIIIGFLSLAVLGWVGDKLDL